MKKYVCSICGYEYEPEKGVSDAGVKPGTPFEDVSADFVCPDCGVGKENFKPED